jgi:aminoglycoside phosphotransferase (APT) family kinase protein
MELWAVLHEAVSSVFHTPRRLAEYVALRRSIFHLKTDQPPNKLRHDIVIKGDTIIRHSQMGNPDLSMWVERMVVEKAAGAGARIIHLEIGNDDKSTYHVMARAKGIPLAEVPAGRPRQIAFCGLGMELARLHQIQGKGAGFVYPSDGLVIGVQERWADHLLAKLGNHIQIPDLFYVNHRISTLISTFCDTAHVYPTVLLHADLNPHNIFVNSSSAFPITAILDWEDALVGDPIYDLANWATFHDAEEDDWDQLFAGYYARTERPSDFDWRFWIYYLRISVSKYVQLQRYGFPDLTRARRRIDRALEALE